MAKTYLFQPDKKFFKQGYTLLDENQEVVYEAKMTKFSLFGAFLFNFMNKITQVSEEHKVGHTITSSQSGMLEMFTTKSWFKFDGRKVWDYLHEQGVRLDSKISKGALGMTYEVTLKGQPVATLSTSMPNGKKSIITTKHCYDVVTEEEYLDLAFLVAFALARTEQVFYQ